jgi:hypothetical protein
MNSSRSSIATMGKYFSVWRTLHSWGSSNTWAAAMHSRMVRPSRRGTDPICPWTQS